MQSDSRRLVVCQHHDVPLVPRAIVVTRARVRFLSPSVGLDVGPVALLLHPGASTRFGIDRVIDRLVPVDRIGWARVGGDCRIAASRVPSFAIRAESRASLNVASSVRALFVRANDDDD